MLVRRLHIREYIKIIEIEGRKDKENVWSLIPLMLSIHMITNSHTLIFAVLFYYMRAIYDSICNELLCVTV
jgi:hypothetical protein